MSVNPARASRRADSRIAHEDEGIYQAHGHHGRPALRVRGNLAELRKRGCHCSVKRCGVKPLSDRGYETLDADATK